MRIRVERLANRIEPNRIPFGVPRCLLNASSCLLSDSQRINFGAAGSGTNPGCQVFNRCNESSEVCHTSRGLIQTLGDVVDRPPASSAFRLLWTPDTMRNPPTDTAPELFTAVQEQLGLKLAAARVPTDVFVIDAATRPTPN